MIVRLSGADAQYIASQVITVALDEPVSRRRLRLSAGIEFSASVYRFLSPRSYTGEDTIEFHIPANPLLARMLLEALVNHGAHHAQPGEFTARAYFNGRMDLAQAEGVSAMISASNDAELRAARQLLSGELARRVAPAMDLLADTLALIEVGIDFSDEDVEFLGKEEVIARLTQINQMLDELLRESARIERLHHTPQCVLIGRPNAGKSTLLNALAGEPRAVVSPQAGTTRDALSADVILSRGIIRLIDVAGIEASDNQERCDTPATSITLQMQVRARQALESADHVILVRACDDPHPPLQLNRAADLCVWSKRDLTLHNLVQPALAPSPGTPGEGWGEGLRISALTGENLPALRAALDTLAFGKTTASSMAINARHIAAIEEARASIQRARDSADHGAELIAVELRDALDALGEILGQITPDDVLGRVFSRFCIGK